MHQHTLYETDEETISRETDRINNNNKSKGKAIYPKNENGIGRDNSKQKKTGVKFKSVDNLFLLGLGYF